MTSPIAYTYEADTHCPTCAEARYGRSADGRWIAPEDSTDSEGNNVGAVAPWDEWHVHGEGAAPYVLACGTCQGVIERCDEN